MEEKDEKNVAKQVYDDVVNQIAITFEKTYDEKTGLWKHGWDEKKRQIWADPATGRAAHAWGRAVGWYMVALVDSLELLPQEMDGYTEILRIFRTLSQKLLSIREDGVWLQVLDCPGRAGNYPESSASCLICYALLKGTRLGYLPKETGIEVILPSYSA